MISRNSITGRYPTKRLGEIVEFLDGLRRPVTESDRRPGPFPYYGANGHQGSVDDYIFDEPLVLLAEDGGHFGTPDRGIAYRISGKTWVNNHAHVLRPKAGLDFDFLCRALENYDVTPWVTGTTRGKLTQAGAAEVAIPFPPLPEQRRIAEILDKADALRAKRRAALAQLDTLTQSIFLDMFGEPGTNQNSIPTTPLGMVCKRITDGTHQPPVWSASGHPFLFVSNVVTGDISFQTQKFISEETHAELTRRCPIEIGDVLYTTVGSYGVPAVVKTDRKFAFQRHIAHLKPDRSILEPEFLRAMLGSEPLKRQADVAARGVAQKTVNLAEIRKFLVFCPPLEMQHDFVQQAESVEAIKSMHRAALAELDALFTSLQHRAFRGEL